MGHVSRCSSKHIMSPLPLPIFHPQSITRQREQVALGELNNGVMNGVAIFFVTANLDCENRLSR
jgi:hypothetical protein